MGSGGRLPAYAGGSKGTVRSSPGVEGAIEKIVAMLPEALGKIKISKGKKEAEEPKAE